MTEVKLDLQSTARGSPKAVPVLQLHIDLLRTAGSAEAYHRLAQTINASEHAPLWQQLASAVEIRQGEHRIALSFVRASAPEHIALEDFLDPFQWPRMNLTFAGTEPVQRDGPPVQVVFKARFTFEEPIALTMHAEDHSKTRWLVTGQPGPHFNLNGRPVMEPNLPLAFAALWDSAIFGFTHVLPLGFDHILFLIALALSCRLPRQIFLMVTLFTLAHCLSLALAARGIVEFNSAVIEYLILASIVWYGINAMRRPAQQTWWHYVTLFVIGLVHGLGFANGFALMQTEAHFLQHLLAFNIGIEAAQLLVVVIASLRLTRLQTPVVHKVLATGISSTAAVWLTLNLATT
ncbi:MAG: HupE/UreJ family protein [Pseudomonadota bacterium]